MPKIKLATFNVNSIRTRLDLVLAFLKSASPDILCIQETKVEDDKFPREELEKAGYSVTAHGQKAYNGVAIISKSVPKKISTGLRDLDEPSQARLLHANIDNLDILNCYVPQGRERDTIYFDYKLEWLKRFKQYLSHNLSPQKKIIVCGDLNIAPTPIDVYDPKRLFGHVCYNEFTTQFFNELLLWGFVDIFRKYHPEPGQYTYYDFRMKTPIKGGNGWRVDHILATKPLASKSTDSHIDLKPRLAKRPSDHAPLLAEFDL